MKLDWIRTSLIVGIAIVSFTLVIRWNEMQQQQTQQPSQETVVEGTSTPDDYQPEPSNQNDDSLPELPENYGDSVPELVTPQERNTDIESTKTKLIEIRTDVHQFLINPVGGDIVKAGLPNYYAKLETPDEPFILLNQNNQVTYIARSVLNGSNGKNKFDKLPLFSSTDTHYQLLDSQDELHVDLEYEQSPEITITKRFTFTRSNYLVKVSYLIDNRSTTTWTGKFIGRTQRDGTDPSSSIGIGMKPYFGAATTTQEKNFTKVKFKDFPSKEKLEEAIKNREYNEFYFTNNGGWVSIIQHYFLSAWIPDPKHNNTYMLYKSENGLYNVAFHSQSIKIQPGQQGEISASFYAGPKNTKNLEPIAPFLDLTVDYKFLWWIAKPLFYVMDKIHDIFGNWGVAIILLTLLIKLIFFIPSATSYRSMAKMRKLQPKMQQLKEKFGEDRQRFSQEMMKLYKKEKVNPLSGCLPILIQMPVFLALYWVLMESVELRHSPFMLWIEDLSVKDPLYVLPLVMGATMWIQQKLNPTPPDPMQAKVMQMMPIMFTFMFLFFPAGLVLYWVANNTLSIAQQYFITKSIEKSD